MAGGPLNIDTNSFIVGNCRDMSAQWKRKLKIHYKHIMVVTYTDATSLTLTVSLSGMCLSLALKQNQKLKSITYFVLSKFLLQFTNSRYPQLHLL